jgi:hypothetical protein
MSSDLFGGKVGGGGGLITTADLQVTPEAAAEAAAVQPGLAGEGCPGLERFGLPRDLSITLKQAADDWMDWSGKGSTRPPPAARARAHQGESEDLGMTAQDMSTLLKDFTACGCGDVGSTVAHRRAQQQRRAKAAVVSAGLVGNRYAVLAEELEADGTPVVPLVPDSGRTLECSSSLGAAEAADAPWCGSCAGALAELVCSKCELHVLLGLVREATHFFTSCANDKEGRRRLARLKQMMVSAGLEDRMCEGGSPTLRAALAEFQLHLLA